MGRCLWSRPNSRRWTCGVPFVEDIYASAVIYVGKVIYAFPQALRRSRLAGGPAAGMSGNKTAHTTSPMRKRSPMVLTGGLGGGGVAERIMHRDVTYGENVIYGPTAKVRRRDAGSARHAIDRAAAQFPNCRACSP